MIRPGETCRNGHERTEANTYISPKGARQCKDCPGWIAKHKKGYRTTNARPKRKSGELGKLNERELRHLRSLVFCVVCGEIPGTDGKIKHWPTCRVPSNPEGEPRKRGPKPGQQKKIIHIRQCPVCGGDFEAIEYQGRVCKIYCTDACRSQSARDRRKSVA